ncbi:YceI family protein [Pedomonas mirosovicensis]|uniref:YceI family protein n=1 Tax=Pedomonas mirosovicensis TaxID=2908641 RepID=UPI0021697264|nr:YceI family protein [Pedomonas mirosovicensis]MCH8684792.1 YceI family protein [Pedomonas mirosovicensis]
MKNKVLAALVAAPLLAGPLLVGGMAGVAVAQTAAPALEVPSGTYALDPTHASVTWKVNHLGLSNYTARFTKFNATLDFDAGNPEKSSLTVSIDPKSVRTDYPFPEKEDFDAKIAGPDFLDAAKYPEIKFVSTKVERLGTDAGKVHGNLTFHGVTKPIVMNVKLVGAKKHPMLGVGALGFSGTTTFKRSDFGVTTLVPMVGDEVTVQVEAEFAEQK